MEAAQMNNDGSGDTALVEQNSRMWDDKKGLRNEVVGEAQGLGSSEEDESRTNDRAREKKNGSEGVIQVPAGPQKLQPQGPAIHWERFLPTGTLKVLLVESDDSTRHVVTALLRNCSYEVTAVANGLQAWRILQDLTNHIDLVLTEVAMPVLSGIGLLCKIMSHKTLKNIPVIMMSSHDSMGLVFKCLSKGAVDFLVKPIRKNELKNLWQHVWRRCHSSSGSGSGSGSESGTQSKKPVKSKGNDESENNSGSSDEHDDRSVGLSIQDGSDNGSGTQSSWTKRAAEVDSSQPISPWNQLADAPDSTCAQVIHTKPETFNSRWVHVSETKDRPEQVEQLDNVAMGKDLEIGISTGLDSQLEYRHKSSTQPSRKRLNNLFELDNTVFEKEQMEIKSENISQIRDCVANLIGVVSSCADRQVESRDLDTPSGLADTAQIKDKPDSDAREYPSLALTMKTVKGIEDVETSMHDDRNVLRHSDLSAFSKYYPGFSTNQGPTGNIGSCSPLENNSVALKTETMHNSNTTPPNQQSNESINNNDMASTTRYIPKLEALNNKSESTSAFKYSHSALQPVQNAHIFPGKEVDVAVDNNQVQARESTQPVQVQHHHHHYHHHHHHVHKMKHQQQRDHDDLSLKNMAADSPQCGSSNMVGAPSEGHVGKYSVNGSVSGSNHGSNGQNGSDNGIAGNTQVTGVTGRNSDEDRFAQREAALIKFRQKRKERCFEKKVRYQSRKRLAEQRPRVRGQFVRQIGSDNKAHNDEQDNIKPDDNSCDSQQ